MRSFVKLRLCFARITGHPRSLSFYVEFALANYHEPTCRKALSEAAADYVAAKEHEFDQDLISETYLVRLRREMKRLQKRCPVATVPDPAGMIVIILAGEFAGMEGVCLGRAADNRKWAVSPEGSDRIVELEFDREFGLLINSKQEPGRN